MEETRKRRFARASAVPIGLLASGALVFAGSQAAFTATTDNKTNTWQAGKVMLKNDGAKGTAVFDVSSTPAAFPASGTANMAIKPGQSGTKCIVVENSSNLDGEVRFYVPTKGGVAQSPGTAALSSELLVKVEFATGTYASCASYPASPQVVFGGATGAILAGAPATWAAAATGVWSPTGDTTNDYGTYRITWSLPSAATDAVQNGTATADFQWEIRNT